MKVAIIFHDANYYSGATRSMLDIIDNWKENNKCEILAVFPQKAGTAIDYLKEKGIATYSCKYYDSFVLLNQPNIKKILKFPKYISKYIATYITGTMILSKKLRKEKYDVIYTNVSGVLLGAWVKKKMDIVHVWHFREYGEEDHRLGIFGGRKNFYKIVNKYCNAVVCISNSLKNKYCKYIDNNLLYRVYDDVSKKYINFTEKNFQEKTFNILIAGQISEGKKQHIAIEMQEKLSSLGMNSELWIAGTAANENYYNKIKQQISRSRERSKIHLLGHVNEMNTLRKKMHFGVVPSESEAFGRVTIEGMLSGMIMICSNSGANKELITDGYNGFLFEINEIDKVCNRIIECEKKGKLSKISQNAFDYGQKFTKGRGAFEIMDIMERINK